MVRVYMLLWPFCMIFASSLVILMFLYGWDGSDGADPDKLVSPPHQESNWVADESFNEWEWNYGIIVDAGSSGSRVFVYVWPPHSGDPHELIKIRPLLDKEKNAVVKKVSPGLSSYGTAPQNASNHMQILLDYVVQHIPAAKHKETSLFIMATAGLRLIPEEQSSAILSNLRKELPKLYDFIIIDKHIEMISGKWEGIYSWIAVNYVLGRLAQENNAKVQTVSIWDQEANKTIQRPKTVGMIDMGGGSMQIAFELTSGWEKVPRTDQHLTHAINLGCMEHDFQHTYRLYVSTFLGFGANSAMKRYEEALTKEASKNSSLSFPGTVMSVNDECLNLDMTKTVHAEVGSTGATKSSLSPSSLVYQRKGLGQWSKCVDKLRQFLEKEKCQSTTCSMAGIYQPEISFDHSNFYGFSEFWYSFNDVLGLGGSYSYDSIRKEAEDYCKTEWSVILERKRKKLYERADSFRLRNQCFKSAWAAAVLHDGFGFPKSWKHFTTVSTINNQEVQWTLGAVLYKLRYFPLGDIQRLRKLEKKPKLTQTSWFSSSAISQLILLLCMVMVVAMGLKHWVVVKKYSKQGLPRNRSVWGYMMIDQANVPALDGIRTERAHYVL